MVEVVQSATFAHWFDGLRDKCAKARIDARLRRLSLGNPGDTKPVGAGISELRIDHGPGYRVYFMRRGAAVIVLCGGGKRTQQADIPRAKALANEWNS